MALPVWQDVLNIAPADAIAFSDPSTPGGRTPTAAQVAILAMATALCNAGVWGANLNYGIVYLAAHIAKLGVMAGTGAVTSEALGQMSRSYSTPQGIMGTLGQTSYGAFFRMLMKANPASLGACI